MSTLNNKSKKYVKSCPFCNHLLLKGKILKKTQNWLILKSYKPIVDPHLIIIPFRHIRTLTELEENEEREYFTIMRYAFKFCKKDPMLFINGKKGQSVKHLHIHLFPNKYRPFEVETRLR